jgi:hypothetical protein
MKTTVEIDDALLKAAKKLAVDEGVSLRELIESGLRDQVARGAAQQRLATWGGPDNTSRDPEQGKLDCQALLQ